jgi:hypothetical protein
MSEANRSFAQKIASKDIKLSKIVDKAMEAGDYETVFKTMNERYILYSTALKSPISEAYYLYFSSRTNDITSMIAILRTKQEFAEQTAIIVSRLDVLEQKVNDILKQNNDQNSP